jgi:malate/lactate dehydrogenase
LTAVEPEDVLVMAFGGHTASGQTRLDLARANLAICEEVAGDVEVGGLPRVSLVATSPLDVLTEYLTRRWAGRMVDVIGSDTSLDTWRLRGELSSICRVHPGAVHAWVVGEHGDWLCCCSVQQQSPASHSMSSLGRQASTRPSSGWQRLPRPCELLHIECANSKAQRGTRSD